MTGHVYVTSDTGADGATVVQVDTEDHEGRVRINLNDGTVWDHDPELGPADPGSLAGAVEQLRNHVRALGHMDEGSAEQAHAVLALSPVFSAALTHARQTVD